MKSKLNITPSSCTPASDPPLAISNMKIDPVWFHMFSSMVKGGALRKMGANGTQVYLVIKAHTNLDTGATFPSVATITEQTGLSKSSVIRSLKRLMDEGYVIKTRRGRRNFYRVVEVLDAYDTDGMRGQLTFEYVPKQVQEIMGKIKAELRDLEVPVYIENLQINCVNVNGSIQIGVLQTPKNRK